jgi:hypothetical protein
LAGSQDMNSLAARRLSFDAWADESQGGVVGSSSVGFSTPTKYVPPKVRFIFFIITLSLITCNIFMTISIYIAVLLIQAYMCGWNEACCWNVI